VTFWIKTYKPEKGSLGYFIVRRTFEIRIGRLEIAFYWHYK
jgi:hypothetical protein